MKQSTRIVTILGATLFLASCDASPRSLDPSELEVWCHGQDRIYAWDGSSYAGGLFVVPNHQECAP